MIRFHTLTLRLAALLTGAAALSACATMSESECASADWRTIGFVDGADGQTLEKLADRREACADHGVTADAQAYRLGREDGLSSYCRASSGFDAGARGDTYRGVCPRELEEAFLIGYEDGRSLYEARQEVSRIENRISELERERDRLWDDMQRLEDEIETGTLSSDERRRNRQEIREISRERGQIDGEIFALQDELREGRALVSDLQVRPRY